MMKSRRGIVWILGAGFSKFLGAPLLNELLTEASLRRLRAIYRGDHSVLDPLRQADGVTTFYLWGKSEGRAYWQNAEEFLERLDYAALQEVQARTFGLALKEFADPYLQKMMSEKDFRDPPPGSFSIDLFDEQHIDELRLLALRLAAAEVSGFLEGADPRLERWAPYRAWAQSLQPEDTVLTFNYDLVPETLNGVLDTKLQIVGIDPSEGAWAARVIKMHGSIDWYLQDDNNDGIWDRIERSNQANLKINTLEKMGMATPGPRKDALIQSAFRPLWGAASQAIMKASAIVFCGYRMPPTDAGTKQWMVSALRSWLELKIQPNPPQEVEDVMPAHIVLGPRDNEGHAERLQLLLRSVSPRLDPTVWPLGAEDFLGTISRERLLSL